MREGVKWFLGGCCCAIPLHSPARPQRHTYTRRSCYVHLSALPRKTNTLELMLTPGTLRCSHAPSWFAESQDKPLTSPSACKKKRLSPLTGIPSPLPYSLSTLRLKGKTRCVNPNHRPPPHNLYITDDNFLRLMKSRFVCCRRVCVGGHVVSPRGPAAAQKDRGDNAAGGEGRNAPQHSTAAPTTIYEH